MIYLNSLGASGVMCSGGRQSCAQRGGAHMGGAARSWRRTYQCAAVAVTVSDGCRKPAMEGGTDSSTEEGEEEVGKHRGRSAGQHGGY